MMVVLALALVAATESRAIAAPFELAWSAPEGCPSSEEIVRATHAHLDEGIEDEPVAFVVHGRVDARSDGYVVALELRDRGGAPLGEREIKVDHASCREVVEPSALLLAMMIVVARSQTSGDADAPLDASSAPGPGPPPPDERRGSPRSEKPPARSPGPSPSGPDARVHAGFAAGAAASIGTLPNPGIGGYARVTIARARLFAGLDIAYEDGGNVPAPGGTIGFTHASATVRAGLFLLQWERVTLGMHLGARGGLLQTSPQGTFVVRTDTRPTVSAGAGGLVRFALTRQLQLEVLPEVHAALRRDELELLDQGRRALIHRTPPLEGRLSLGLCFELP